jgi:hypothetical protein
MGETYREWLLDRNCLAQSQATASIRSRKRVASALIANNKYFCLTKAVFVKLVETIVSTYVRA